MKNRKKHLNHNKSILLGPFLLAAVTNTLGNACGKFLWAGVFWTTVEDCSQLVRGADCFLNELFLPVAFLVLSFSCMTDSLGFLEGMWGPSVALLDSGMLTECEHCHGLCGIVPAMLSTLLSTLVWSSKLRHLISSRLRFEILFVWSSEAVAQRQSTWVASTRPWVQYPALKKEGKRRKISFLF